jgi:hypothetical protein
MISLEDCIGLFGLEENDDLWPDAAVEIVIRPRKTVSKALKRQFNSELRCALHNFCLIICAPRYRDFRRAVELREIEITRNGPGRNSTDEGWSL